jgi:hypothetical protein
MGDHRDVGVIVLVLLAITGLTILFLKLGEPSGSLVELLFPRV